MEYNDFSILTDSEYIKLANEYNTYTTNKNSYDTINSIFYLLEKCKKDLCLSNSYINYKIKNELTSHLQTLTKLSNNIKLMFSPKEININNYNDFNLFIYLSNLIEIENNLNNWLISENKSNNKKFILNSKNEINNIIISLLNILSKSNIHFFKHM